MWNFQLWNSILRPTRTGTSRQLTKCLLNHTINTANIIVWLNSLPPAAVPLLHLLRWLFWGCFCPTGVPLPSARQHPSYGDCLEVKREYYQNCSVLDCVTQCSQSAAYLYEQFIFQISYWIHRWKNFENRQTSGKVMNGKYRWCFFLVHSVYQIINNDFCRFENTFTF